MTNAILYANVARMAASAAGLNAAGLTAAGLPAAGHFAVVSSVSLMTDPFH